MQRNFETSFVTQCAPVLAGLKVANLFRWVEPDASAIQYYLRFWLSICRTSLTVSALRIMRYCLKI